MKYEQYKREKLQELQEKNRIQQLVNENNVIIQKKKVKDLIEERDEHIEKTRENKKKDRVIGILTKIPNIFDSNKNSPIFDLTLTPKERKHMKKQLKE